MKCHNLHLSKLTENHAHEICSWKYTKPYHIYNFSSYEHALKENEEITDSDKRDKEFCGVFDDENNLCGFVHFNKLDNFIRLGLGLKPELCGIGIGNELMKIVLEEAKKREPSCLIDLEVLTWNERAFKLYIKSGFETVETYERKTPTGKSEFHRMVYSKK